MKYIFVILSACMGLGFMAWFGVRSVQPVRAQDAPVTPAPSSTPVSTPIPMPTYDSRQADALATSAAANATSAIAYATIGAVEQERVIAAQAQATVIAAQATGTLSANMAEQQLNDIRAIATMTAVHNYDLSVDIEHRNRMNVGTAYGYYAGIGAVIFLVLAAGFVLFRFGATIQPRAEEYVPQFETPTPTPSAPVALPAYPAGLDIRQIVPGIATSDQLYQIARGVVDSVPFTHDNWTPANVCMSEGRFASLQRVLTQYGLALWLDDTRHNLGVELTPRGEQFFREVLAGPRETPPPPAPLVSKTPESDGYLSIDTNNSPT